MAGLDHENSCCFSLSIRTTMSYYDTIYTRHATPNHFTLKMIFSPSLLVDFIHSREWCLQPVNLSHLTCPAAIAGLLQVHQLERYASGIRYSNMTYYDLPGRPGHVLFVYSTLNVRYEYGCIIAFCPSHVP